MDVTSILTMVGRAREQTRGGMGASSILRRWAAGVLLSGVNGVGHGGSFFLYACSGAFSFAASFAFMGGSRRMTSTFSVMLSMMPEETYCRAWRMAFLMA